MIGLGSTGTLTDTATTPPTTSPAGSYSATIFAKKNPPAQDPLGVLQARTLLHHHPGGGEPRRLITVGGTKFAQWYAVPA